MPTGFDVAAGKRIATIETSSPNDVQILDGHTWHAVTLPAPGAGLRGTDSNFVTAVSGRSAIAGVYRIKTKGGAVRVATTPGPDPR